MKPVPGTATGQDVLRIKAKEDLLCELVNGTLIEKTVAFWKSMISVQFAICILRFAHENDLGIVTGAGGPIRLHKDRIRMPDVGYYGWHHFPNRVVPDKAIPRIYPDLAVEVISPKNTKKEMAKKLREYFKAGTTLVWYVYPQTKTVEVYTSPTNVKTLTATDTLTGGDVLPGFKMKVGKVFA